MKEDTKNECEISVLIAWFYWHHKLQIGLRSRKIGGNRMRETLFSEKVISIFLLFAFVS